LIVNEFVRPTAVNATLQGKPSPTGNLRSPHVDNGNNSRLVNVITEDGSQTFGDNIDKIEGGLSEYPVVNSVKQDDRCLSRGTSSFNPCIVSVSGSAQIEVASPNVSRISFRPSAEGICTIPPLASVTLQGQRNCLTSDENRRGGRPYDLNSVHNTPPRRQYLDEGTPRAAPSLFSPPQHPVYVINITPRIHAERSASGIRYKPLSPHSVLQYRRDLYQVAEDPHSGCISIIEELHENVDSISLQQIPNAAEGRTTVECGRHNQPSISKPGALQQMSTPESVPCNVAVLSGRGRQDSPSKLCAEHQNESYTFQALNNSVAVMLERENSYHPDLGMVAPLRVPHQFDRIL
jgi:hypothetical protein